MKRLVVEAFVENRLAVVADVPVAFVKMKFCSVEEPETRRFARVVKPDATFRVPVNAAADEIVWPLMRPDVIGPAVNVPMFPVVANRFVDDAVVANIVPEKKFVVVA